MKLNSCLLWHSLIHLVHLQNYGHKHDETVKCVKVKMGKEMRRESWGEIREFWGSKEKKLKIEKDKVAKQLSFIFLVT